jgi:hypothetical protein
VYSLFPRSPSSSPSEQHPVFGLVLMVVALVLETTLFIIRTTVPPVLVLGGDRGTTTVPPVLVLGGDRGTTQAAPWLVQHGTEKQQKAVGAEPAASLEGSSEHKKDR